MKLVGLELPPILNDALLECRRHFMAAAGFSLLINVLYLAPTLYMLQVYDRVVPTGGKATLFFITLGLAIALMTRVGVSVRSIASWSARPFMTVASMPM